MEKTIKSFVVFLLCLLPSFASAQTDSIETEVVYDRGWYVGAQGGLSFGVNTFSSFANDKTRYGWNGGIFVGYMFNDILSLEASAGLGKFTLAERDCCNDRGYFLGSDWNRYKYVPAGMAGHYYKDLASEVFTQRYGLKLNFNVLGLFNGTKDSRWRINLSPAVYAVGTSADIKTLADDEVVREDIDNWHLGVGGSAEVSYAITKHLNLGVYGGVTFLTGPKVMDGMPELHHDNHIIDGGLRLAWNFGASRPVKKVEPSVVFQTVVDTVYIPQPVVQPVVEPEKVVEVAVKEDDDTDHTALDERFPIVYFSFNSVWIEPKEKSKVREIAAFLKANPDMRVRISGYGCKIGGEEVNKRVSLMRAKAVKTMLVSLLVPASRIEVEGLGIKHDVQKNTDARIVTTREIVK